MFTLRDYQENGVQHLLEDAEAKIGSVGIFPTGAGKTVVLRELIRRWLQDHPEQPVLLLAHRTRLLTQAQEKFAGIPTNVISAGMGLREEPFPGAVTVASIQTISTLPFAAENYPWSLVLIDEAHRVGEDNQYGQFLKKLPETTPISGVTATPWRWEKGQHVPIWEKGLTGIFQRPACWVHPEPLIQQGWLLRPEMVPIQHAFPRIGKKLEHGEFPAAKISEYLKMDFAQRIQEIQDKTCGCDHVLVFCASIQDAEKVSDALRQRGETSMVLHGKHAETERNAEIVRFQQKKTRYLINVDVFTEGLDVPEIDAVVMLRMTRSVIRYLQMAGRGLRPASEEQHHCRILDFGHHVERLGPIEAERGRNGMPVYRSRQRIQESAPESGKASQAAMDNMNTAPRFTESEASFCVPVQDLQLIPAATRNGKNFLVMRFQVDHPEANQDRFRTLRVERKLFEGDPVMKTLLDRWQRISGERKYVKGESQIQRLLAMFYSGRGFLPYVPFAVRVRWSGRAEKWMVDGWQWSGKQKMDISEMEEKALAQWIQKTQNTPDAQDQVLRQVLYRLAHEGVLDLRVETQAALKMEQEEVKKEKKMERPEAVEKTLTADPTPEQEIYSGFSDSSSSPESLPFYDGPPVEWVVYSKEGAVLDHPDAPEHPVAPAHPSADMSVREMPMERPQSADWTGPKGQSA
ncbi:DEAD/DEAH box helicase [Acidithiobacillus thiooxidans]|uniref:DEAD/DEAH box helicase n=1 Tax=Acidithiobacillus thiooxidans TaxID=930 RepID=UPI00356B3B77|nr:DEAD/DEAH box helicase [Acidithiobacillus sp.]